MNFCLFYISASYDDGEKGCKVWDPTAHKIIINSDIVFVQNCKVRFVCKLDDSLYSLKVPRTLYKRLEYFMVSQNFSRGKYDYTINSTFTILMLFVDDMLIASQSMVEISEIKAHLDKTFQMKYQ